MLNFLRPTRPEPMSTDSTGPIWAVGDVHGCADLLQALLAQVLSEHTGKPVRIVFLGDYVDRGPASREVLDLLIALESLGRVRPTFIRGNHDFMMQEFLRKPEIGPAWLEMGAAATLRSYGVEPPGLSVSPQAWRDAHQRFLRAVPRRHSGFLDRLEPSLTEGDYFFTHAGVRPGRSLDRQRSSDLMWIRTVFLDDPQPLPKMVVHGHTVTPAPYADHRRIGLDTGAYASGTLTALRVEGATRRFLQVRRTPDQRIETLRDVPSRAAL